MSYLDQSLSQLATEIPGASAVFHKYKMNFCCQGNLTLQEALEKKTMKADEVVHALNALRDRQKAQPDWSEATTETLIDHILTRFHDVHRQQLPELIRLAQRVETVHHAHPLCPAGLSEYLKFIQQDLDLHMMKEEQVLFPMLRDAIPSAAGPILAMKSEHEQHEKNIEHFFVLTHNLHLHPEACNTWRALYLGLQEFITDLTVHIHLENTVLFARFNQEIDIAAFA